MPRFSNFTQWIKNAIMKKSKKNLSRRNSKRKSKSNPKSRPLSQPISQSISQLISDERSIKRSNSTPRRTPSKKSYSDKRRRSRRRSHRSNFNEVDKIEHFTIFHDKYDDNADTHNNICLDEEEILYNNNYDDDDDDDDDDGVVVVVNINDGVDNNGIIPNISNVNSDPIGLTSIPPLGKDYKDQQRPELGSDDDFLENTRIIKGSVEHFVYVRTLRKLRRDKQRPMNQVVLLNNNLEKISFPSQISDEIYKELIQYRMIVYALKRNSIFKMNDTNLRPPYNSLNISTSSLCPSSLMKKRISAIMAKMHSTSPITMKYRPSYASSKVVTIFDDELNQFIVKDLPMARRKKRLSDLNNILVRSNSTSSNSSPSSTTNSSRSSLATLIDDVEDCSSSLSKDSGAYLLNNVGIIVRKSDDGDYDDDDSNEDDVPLFVLKEQFRYSGRGYGLIKNNLPSLEGNEPIRPLRVTLAV